MKSKKVKTKKMSKFTVTAREFKCLHFSIVVIKAMAKIQILFSLQKTCLRPGESRSNQKVNFEIYRYLT
jgi:hypothetical protein